MNVTGWSRDLSVEVGGRGVINHAGVAAVRLIADRVGVTAGLSMGVTVRDQTPRAARAGTIAPARLRCLQLLVALGVTSK